MRVPTYTKDVLTTTVSYNLERNQAHIILEREEASFHGLKKVVVTVKENPRFHRIQERRDGWGLEQFDVFLLIISK